MYLRDPLADVLEERAPSVFPGECVQQLMRGQREHLQKAMRKLNDFTFLTVISAKHLCERIRRNQKPFILATDNILIGSGSPGLNNYHLCFTRCGGVRDLVGQVIVDGLSCFIDHCTIQPCLRV